MTSGVLICVRALHNDHHPELAHAKFVKCVHHKICSVRIRKVRITTPFCYGSAGPQSAVTRELPQLAPAGVLDTQYRGSRYFCVRLGASYSAPSI
jgi:hypothetical protein